MAQGTQTSKRPSQEERRDKNRKLEIMLELIFAYQQISLYGRLAVQGLN